jgi:predicted ester cyclase
MTPISARPTNGSTAGALVEAKELCVESFEIMRSGTLEDFERILHLEAVNREAKDEPPECRGRGPAAFHATALWLRDAYADLHWEVHNVVADGDLVVVHCTMSGRHVKSFVVFGPDGEPSDAFPATGRTFATTQTHWFRMADGLVIEHWANRDDLGTAAQLGWSRRRPPTSCAWRWPSGGPVAGETAYPSQLVWATIRVMRPSTRSTM